MTKYLVILAIGIFGVYKYFSLPVVKVPNTNIEFKYQVKYTGGASSKETLPLIVALHGNGDKLDNFYKSIIAYINKPARVILIQGPKSYGRGYAWPWNAEDFDKYAEPFYKAVIQLKHKFSTKGEPILFGFSGGAMMAYHQAMLQPDLYSSVFAISGSLKDNPRRANTQKLLTHLKVFCYHGLKDNVVNFSAGKDACNKLKEAGINAKLFEYNDGHLGLFTTQKDKILNKLEAQL